MALPRQAGEHGFPFVPDPKSSALGLLRIELERQIRNELQVACAAVHQFTPKFVEIVKLSCFESMFVEQSLRLTSCASRSFIYQGVALFLNPQAWNNSLNFTVISIFAILFAR